MVNSKLDCMSSQEEHHNCRSNEVTTLENAKNLKNRILRLLNENVRDSIRDTCSNKSCPSHVDFTFGIEKAVCPKRRKNNVKSV